MNLQTSYRIEDLAKVYENILGSPYYSIDVYSNLKIDGNVVQGILKPYRRPYKLSNIKAETVELIFEFYISVRKTQDKFDELSTLSKICGLQKGTFESNGKTYTYHSFLDFASPANSPIANFGDYTQVVVITGTCLVSEVDGGALVSNEIKTKLTFNCGTDEEIEDYVEILNVQYGNTEQTESPILANSDTAKSFNRAQNSSFAYTILLQKNKVGKRLLKAARKIEPFELNEIIKVTDYYPAFDNDGPFNISNDCIVAGCDFAGQAGAFATITLTLQEALKFADLDYEI